MDMAKTPLPDGRPSLNIPPVAETRVIGCSVRSQKQEQGVVRLLRRPPIFNIYSNGRMRRHPACRREAWHFRLTSRHLTMNSLYHDFPAELKPKHGY